MERLTNKAWRNLDPWECCGQDYYCKRGCHDEGGCNKGCIVPKIYNKLAKYEDAEENGLLVRLPCKVGDTVWTNLAWTGWYLRENKKPYVANVVFIGLNDSEKMGGGIINVSYNKGHMMQFTFADIGKTVFLTREEAEAALKGGNDNA